MLPSTSAAASSAAAQPTVDETEKNKDNPNSKKGSTTTALDEADDVGSSAVQQSYTSSSIISSSSQRVTAASLYCDALQSVLQWLTLKELAKATRVAKAWDHAIRSMRPLELYFHVSRMRDVAVRELSAAALHA
jgi:hypothetical protein